MLNESKVEVILNFHQIADALDSYTRTKFSTTRGHDVDSAEILFAIKDRIISRLKKIASLAQTQYDSDHAKIVIWELLYARNIFEILHQLAKAIRVHERNFPGFYDDIDSYCHQFCVVIIKEIYPNEEINGGAQVKQYCSNFVRVTLQYFAMIRYLTSAVNSAYNEYCSWCREKDFFFPNFSHGKEGRINATNFKLTITQYLLKANLIASLVELERAFSYVAPWLNSNSRFHAHSFNTFLLKYISEHNFHIGHFEPFHFQGSAFIQYHKDICRGYLQIILGNPKISIANLDKYEIGVQNTPNVANDPDVLPPNANDRPQGNHGNGYPMEPLVPIAGNDFFLVNKYNQVVLFQMGKITKQFQLHNKNLNQTLTRFDEYITNFRDTQPNRSENIISQFHALSLEHYNNPRDLLVNIGILMYKSIGGAEGVSNYSPFLHHLMAFIYCRTSESIYDYIIFSDLCWQYSLIRNNLQILIVAAKDEYQNWYKSKGWFFPYRNFTHHDSDIEEANIFCARIHDLRGNLLVQLELVRRKLQTASLSAHSFESYLIKYLYFSITNRTEFHDQSIERIREQRGKLMEWLAAVVEERAL